MDRKCCGAGKVRALSAFRVNGEVLQHCILDTFRPSWRNKTVRERAKNGTMAMLLSM